MAKVTQMKKPGDERSKIVDELGGILAQLAPVRPLLKREEALKKQIRGWAEKAQPAETPRYQGTRYTVHLSARKNQRSVDTLKLYAKIGKQKFLEVCSVAVKAVEELFPLDEREAFIREEQSGSRELTVLPRLRDAA